MRRAFIAFIAGLMIASATYGFMVGRFRWFPYKILAAAHQGYLHVSRQILGERPWFYQPAISTTRTTIFHRESIAPGLTLVSAIGPDSTIEARVVTIEGTTIHKWSLDWFKLWPDATHIHPRFIPQSPPGTHVQGILLLENGDLIFNLERTGLYRVDICGNTVWRVPRMTHHSLHRDEDGNFWVPGLDIVDESRPERPGYASPYHDYKILKISNEGEIIREWSVIELLQRNQLESLLYMSTLDNAGTVVTGDTLHMNDVKTFPSNLPSGLFGPGDVMLSLRNINAVLVFDSALMYAKYLFIGPFVRQHDPDFVDGNSITVFDNYVQSAESGVPHSRILRLSTDGRPPVVIFAGTKDQPFFTGIMGKLQRLANGNYLLTEATAGRAIEVTADGKIVWEYVNLVEEGWTGLMDEAQRLDPVFDVDYFHRLSKDCGEQRL